MAQFGVGRPAWAGSALDDQHTAGGIMWAVAEVLDLPFLVLAATRWLRADAAEARRVDAELDAADAAKAVVTDIPPGVSDTALSSVTSNRAPAGARPWWLDDPELRDRYRG
jgi:putative membrane protein